MRLRADPRQRSEGRAMFMKFLKKIYWAIVWLPGGAIRLVGKAIRAAEALVKNVADAIAVAAVPLATASNGETNIAIATKVIVTKYVPTKVIIHTGIVTKAVAKPASFAALKLGWWKGAAALGKVAGASSIVAGTTVLSCGLALGFIGLVWIGKKLAAPQVRKLIEAWKGLRETEVLVGEIVAAA